MNYLTNKTTTSLLIAIFFLLSACTPLIGPYSQKAYENATSLKVETLTLMDRALTPYANNTERVENLEMELKKAYEYVKGVPNNNLSASQWKILIDKDGRLVGKFFKRWEEREVLKRIMIDEYKKIVSDSFDEIICLEANKKEPSECKKNKGL